MIDFLRRILLQVSPDISLQFTSTSSSQQAEKINQLTNYFFYAATLILFIVIALTTYVIIRFRHKNNQLPNSKKLNPKWEIVMLGIPLLLVIIFFFLSMNVTTKIAPQSKEKIPDVVITGHQWWWQADYPEAGVTTANEIHLPVNKDLLLKLESQDVIHSWWIPQFGNKMDMIPSQDNFLEVNIKAPGTYYGTCSEFCGDQHAHMQIIVYAESDSAYNEWLTHSRKRAATDSSEQIQDGKRLFIEKTCSNCHTIKGTEANGINGPDLTHLASRSTLLAGVLVNNVSNLKSWISKPQKIKPGAYMPDFAMEDSTVESITAYLSSLK